MLECASDPAGHSICDAKRRPKHDHVQMDGGLRQNREPNAGSVDDVSSQKVHR
jgi:hypothetical protein